ncbi:T9SS type A sorting domain-containing protein [Psychroserpens sp.]|uniref:T9SS type A sorting domain-containing protein n=1 Tax=Psychroserpens sp. TaxID=2020870 RepID=UPI003FA7E4AD
MKLPRRYIPVGQSVFATEDSITASEFKIKTLGAGAYIVRLDTETEIFSKKIIVN